MKRLLWAFFAFACVMTAHAQSTKERLTEHVYSLAADSLEGRGATTPAALKAARYVAEQFAGIGLETYDGGEFLHSFAVGRGKGHNVIGILEGCDPALKGEWIILGAHFDHLGTRKNGSEIYHGADDNASGTAALIEMARALASRRSELRRSVMFVAFDAEELGLLGSSHLAENLTAEEIKFMASVDMVGWLHKSERLKITGVGMLDGGESIFRGVDDAGEWLKLKNFDTAILTGSDHEPFASRGIPAVLVTTGTVSPYHKPEDSADKIDYDGLTRVTGYMTAATAEMASRDRLEASGKLSFKHRKEPLLEVGITASIGSNKHNYKEGALDGKSAFAWNAGMWTRINFGNWAVRPKVVYEQRRARVPIDFQQRTSTTLKTGGLYVPVDLMYKLRADGMSGIYLYLFGGGYYSRVFTGKTGSDKVDFSASGAPCRDEWGMQWGAGINIYKFWLEGSARSGLTDIFPEGKISNTAGYFSVGYKF